jgi:tRNA (guanosine-2'-O-)-methyltransferase
MKQLSSLELKRLNRDFNRKRDQNFDLCLVLHDITYAQNVGAMFRMADALRLSKIIISGVTLSPEHPTVQKVGRGKDRYVTWEQSENIETTLNGLRQQGYTICALEATENSVPYYDYTIPDKLCLIAGHEEYGVAPKILDACDQAVYLPMFGKGRSLNVHIATSIFCYHCVMTRMLQLPDLNMDAAR